MVTFRVRYRQGEYLSIVREHILAQPSLASSGQLNRALLSALASIFGTVFFLVKSLRIGACQFQIGDSGIVRESRHGKKKILWREVTGIRRYNSGYLIELGTGAMPIPYRVLSPVQRVNVESLFESVAPFGGAL